LDWRLLAAVNVSHKAKWIEIIAPDETIDITYIDSDEMRSAEDQIHLQLNSSTMF